MPVSESDPVGALILIDLQRASVTGAGAVPGSESLLARTSELLDRARKARVLVVHVQNDGPVGAADEPGQPGWSLYLPVVESDRELVIRKVEDDGFVGTDLGAVLERHGAGRVCIVGLLSEMCVLATARTALTRGLGVVLPHDGHATFDIPPGPGSSDGVAAIMAARVAEWALGDGVEIVAHTTEVRFTRG